MTGMNKFMVVHMDTLISWEEVQENWIKLVEMKEATWIRTFYNKDEGARYCIWLAQDKETLKTIFHELNISYESIMVVEETIPDLWGKKWEEHLEAESESDTLGN